MGLPLRGVVGAGSVVAVAGGAGCGDVTVGGGGTGWLRAVLCPPHPESSSITMVMTPSSPAGLDRRAGPWTRAQRVRWKGTTLQAAEKVRFERFVTGHDFSRADKPFIFLPEPASAGDIDLHRATPLRYPHDTVCTQSTHG